MSRWSFRARFPMRVPVIQAPMAGGPSTPELAAAVGEAGGMGSLAVAYSSPEQIASQVQRLRSLSSRPFQINLFAPEADLPLSGNVPAVLDFLGRYHQELGIAPPVLPQHPGENFEAQLEAVLEARPPVVSFTFGILPPPAMDRLHEQGCCLIGTATTVEEAVRLERAGADAVVAQGAEAGGHRGSFAQPAEEALVGTLALVPQVADAVSIPVIAAGGIMDGRGILAALALGAEAAQLGTAFLCTDEAGTGPAFRRALLAAREHETTLTRAFSGRLARGLSNEFVERWNHESMQPLPYPWQNALTRAMRKAAARADRSGLQSLWTGQGLRLLRSAPAAELMAQLHQELEQARRAMLK